MAGDSFTILCPFSGYPIEFIRWEKSGQELVSSKQIDIHTCIIIYRVKHSMIIDCNFPLKSYLHAKIGTKYELSSVQSGGALKIHQIDSNQDSGIYTCIVRNRGGEEARRDIELTVNSKLK